MKKIFCLCSVVVISIIFNSRSESRTVIIFATNNWVFYPNSIGVEVGDTIKFTGSCTEICHSTICDGRPGTTLPAGALPWNSPPLGQPFIYIVRVEGFYRYICGYAFHDGTFNATMTNSPQATQNIDDYGLTQNYPNPFNPETKISFSIPEDEFIKLQVYDVLGREIKILINEFRRQGTYEVNFDGSNVSGGMYFYRITAGDFTETKKMYLIK